MPSQYITTNVRLPRSLYKIIKRRAFEEDKSLAALIREALDARQNPPASSRSAGNNLDGHARIVALADLVRIAEPLGGDLSARVDDIVYGKSSH